MVGKRYREGDEPVPGYRLVDYLGRGGFGEVWKAAGPGGIKVALKIIHDLGRKKGGKELRALRLLKDIRHPNLVPVTAFWLKDADGRLIDDDQSEPAAREPAAEPLRGTMMLDSAAEAVPNELVIAMGLAEQSLFDRLEECRGQGLPGIPQDELLTYMEDAARAIDLLNVRHNIQHCDVKPQNILVLSGAAQVCDFGLAKAIGDMRESSLAAGTIAYGAPEVLLGEGPSHSTDQYSLAVSYCELRTGELPFEGENFSSVLDAKRTGVLDLSRISAPEKEVIRRATAVNPEERYSSTTTMVRALRRCSAEEDRPVAGGPAGPADVSPLPPGGREPLRGTISSDRASTRRVGTSVAVDREEKESAVTVDLAGVDTRASDAEGVDAGPPQKVRRPVRRRRRFRSLVGLLLIVLIAAVAAAPLLKSFQYERQVKRLIDRGQYQAAQRQIESPKAWFAWLVGRDRLRTSLKDKWFSEAEAAYLRGEKADALATCEALLAVFDGYSPAVELRDQIREEQAGRPSIDPAQTLELVRQRIDRALTTPAAKPEKSVADCTEAIGQLDSLGPSLDADQRRQVGDLRRQALLLRARAASRLRPPPWKAVRDDLASLEKEPVGGAAESPSQKALRTALAVVAEDADSSGSRSPAEMLDLLLEHKRASDAVTVADPWIPDATEQAAVKAVGDRVVEELRRMLAGAKSQPRQALPLCEKLLEYLPADAQMLALKSTMEARIGDGVAATASPKEQLRRDIVAAVNDPAAPDFVALYRKCVDAENQGLADAMIRACRAECLVEGSGGPLSVERWKEAEAAAFGTSEPADPADKPYLLYVQALVRRAEPDGPQWEKAAELMDQAFASAEPVPPLPLRRRQRAAEILTAAAAGLVPTASQRAKLPFEQLLDNPFADAPAAGKAYAWLEKAGQLAGTSGIDPSPAAKTCLALAAMYKEEPDLPLAGRLAAEGIAKLAPGDATRDDLPLLYVHARASASAGDPASGLSALGSFAEIVRLAEEEKDATGAEAAPLPMYDRVLEPALTLAESLAGSPSMDDARRKQVASIYAAKGRLIRRNPYEDWKFDDPEQEMFDAYSTAISYDADRAEYYVGRGFARLRLGDFQLADLRDDAEKAVAKDPKYPGGHALLGNVLILQARKATDERQRMPLLSQAVAACTEAITLSRNDDEDLGNYLINRSAAYVEWANSTIDLTLKTQESLLLKARADAEEAVKLDTPYRDFAYRTLGNATEDLAWIVGKREMFPAAVQAFTGAIEERGDLAVAWMDRGRCRFKAVANGGYDATMLDKAIEDLTEATRRPPSKRYPHMAEAYFWLGRVHHYRKDYDKADENFVKSLEVDPRYDPAVFWMAQVAEARGDFAKADALFQQAVTLTKDAKSIQRLFYLMEWARTIQPGDPRMAPRTEKLKAVADRLAGDPAPEAALLVGRVRELEKRWDDAIKVYDGALGKEPTYPNVKPLLYYGRSEARYLSSEATEDLKRTDSQIIRDADTAAKLAVDPNVAALAWAQAAQSRIKAAQLRDSRQLRADAVENFRDAIRRAPKHPHAWSWCWMLVSNWQILEPALHEDDQKYAEAKQYLDQAYASLPASSPYKDRVGRMRKDLEQKRKEFLTQNGR